MKIAYNPKTGAALTTAPANNDITFDLRGLNIFVRGEKFKGTDTTYSVFKKHTSAESGGYNGLVPVPSYTSTNIRFLREDGTWSIPTSLIYTKLTNQNLDDYLDEGKWYYAEGGNSVTNKPSGVNSFELYVGRNAGSYRYQKLITSSGIIWFRYYNAASWTSWVRWYTDENTDQKVLQSATTTTNFRPLILGYNNSTDKSVLANDTTNQVYTTTTIYAQPNTGSLWANKLYSGGKLVLTEHQSLLNYVTLNTDQKITGIKTFTKQQKFTVAKGTAPFQVTSDTRVDNLNASKLDGYESNTFVKQLTGSYESTTKLLQTIDTYKGNHLVSIRSRSWGNLLNLSGQDWGTGLMYSQNALSDTSNLLGGGIWFNQHGTQAYLLKLSGNTSDNSITADRFITNSMLDSIIVSSASTADKLKTKRKLWGQDFDGTADVSGNMTGVGYISMNGDLTIISGNTNKYITFDIAHSEHTNSWRIGYIGSGAGNANYFVLQSTQNTSNTWTSALTITNETLESTFAASVTAPTFKGNLDGTYVNKLTNYKIATTIDSIATTDSLNTALGKLEFKTDFIYNDLFGTDNDDVINKWHEIVDFIDSVKEGTDITDEFVTRKTAQVITGQKNFNTNTGVTPVIISRLGISSEAVAIKVDDNQAIFEYTNDENQNFYVFKMVNTDTELSDGSGANTSQVLFTGNSAGSSVTATTFIGKLNNTLTFSAGTFAEKTYNNSSAVTVNIPTHTSHLVNNSGFLTQHQSLANYVTLNTTQTISGVKTFSTQQNFTVAQGTAPFTVTSTTKVTNLNVDYFDDYDSSRFLKAKNWVTDPGQDANTLEQNMMCFTYSNNAPYVGTIIYFSGASGGHYGLQLNAHYLYPGNLSFRSRNGDNHTWNDWSTILTQHNYTNYVNTTNFPGLDKTGTVTSVTVMGTNGLSGTGTITTSGTITLSNAGVRSTTINGNYLRVNTNGIDADLTIPYATTARSLNHTTLTLGQDLNTLTTEGVYSSTATYVCKSLVNGPTDRINGECRLEVINCGSYKYSLQWLHTKSGKKGKIWYRMGTSDSTWSTWNTIAFTSDIPVVTNYYWANVQVSSSSSTTTTPIFAIATATTSITTPLVTSSGVLTLTGVSGVYLKHNNWDGASIVLSSTYFKPFDAANNKLSLGTNSARWSNVYSVLGNYSGNITALGFVKSGSSDSYILLGGGGHKLASDFMLKTDELSNNLTTITKSLNVTQAWMDTGITSIDIPASGTYIVQVQVSTNDNTGLMYNCYSSGVMSWYKDDTNDTETDEIILHRSGHGYGKTIYLRTIMQSSGVLKLQIGANSNIGNTYTYTFKFKRII